MSWNIGRTWLAGILVISLMPLGVADEPPGKEPKRDKGAEKEKPDNADADPYVVPDVKDVGQLADYLQGLLARRAKSREEMIARRAAVRQASEKIVKLEKDQKSDAYRLAAGILLQLKIADVTRDGTPDEKKALIGEVKTLIVDRGLGTDELELAQSFCSQLEYSDDDKNRALAKEAYTALGEVLKKSKDQDVVEQAEMMIGAGRRLGLVGQPLKLEGTTLAGDKFDVASLKGKVVLVDFWATWCGPCRAEHPNIRKNYEGYHEKGFEVVGVSIDADRGELEDYLKDEEVAWITLHEKDKQGQNAATTYYGIFGIPCMMLLDKEGKVVSLEVRGEKLGEELEKLLGKPVEKKPSEKSDGRSEQGK